MTDHNVHVIIRSGAGIVGRYGTGLLVVLPGGSDEVQQQLLDAMRDSCEGQDLPGRTMARKLVGILSQADPETVPPFGACAPNERGWAVILHQGVAMDVQGPSGTTTLSGFDASTWVDRIVEGGFERLTLLPDGEEVGAIDTRFRFQGGLVPGSGATLLIEDENAAAGTAAPAGRDAYAPPAASTAAGGAAVAEQAPAADEPAAATPATGADTPGGAADEPAAAQEQVARADAGPAQAEAVRPADGPAGGVQGVAPVPVPVTSPPPPPTDAAAQQVAEPRPVAEAQPAAEPQPVAQAQPVAEAQPAMADEEEPPTLIQAPDREAAPVMAEPEAQPLPDDDVPFQAIPLTDIGPEARREPLPILSADTPKDEVADEGAPLVYGVLSPTGYFNHPDALFCAVTGVSMLHRTHVLVQRPRPPLGVVVSDDGSTFTLNSNYVVGREPERDELVEGGEARPLKLSDAERSLSRVHAEIRLVDWDVFIVDRGSANGTYVLPRGAQQWKRLVADTPEKVVPGTRIAFGKRVMTFESHHQINQAAAS